MLRTIRFLLCLPFQAFRLGWRLMVPLLLVASLVFNFALFAFDGFYTLAARTLSSVGITTSAMRQVAGNMRRQEAGRRIVTNTRKRVTHRVQRSAARSIGSAAGEAIPFIGVGVIAGAVALEVKDACDTARDMAGLEAALMAEGDPELAKEAAEEAFDCTAMIREELPSYDDLPTREALWATVRASPRQAWEAARDAGIAVADVDWTGWGTGVVTTAIGLIDRVRRSEADDEPATKE